MIRNARILLYIIFRSFIHKLASGKHEDTTRLKLKVKELLWKQRKNKEYTRKVVIADNKILLFGLIKYLDFSIHIQINWSLNILWIKFVINRWLAIKNGCFLVSASKLISYRSEDDRLELSNTSGVPSCLRGWSLWTGCQQKVHHLSILDPTRNSCVLTTFFGAFEVKSISNLFS